MAAKLTTRFTLAAGVFTSAFVCAAQPTQESLPLGAPARGNGAIDGITGGSISFITTFASLLAVVGLIIICGVIYKFLVSKTGGLAGQVGAAGKSPAGILSVLGRYPLGRGQTLVLLQVDRRVLLLCQSASGRFGRTITTTTLSEIADSDEVASIIAKANGNSSGFEDVLTGFEAEGEAPEFDSDVEVVDLTKRRGGKLLSLIGGRAS
ncbi:MAG: hypothetical protein Phyf2KO_10170 [Phycisphaerales bacterium]